MSDVNTEFRDWLLRNQHYVHRFENGMIRDVTRHYDEASKIISDKIGNLQNWYDEVRYKTAYTMDWRMQRLQKMLDEMEMVMNNASNGVISGLSSDLREYASTYAGALEGELADAFGKANIVLNRIPAAQVFAMVEQPMLGETFGERMLWGDAQSVRLIRDRLTQAVIAGEDMATARNYLLGRGFRMHGKIGDMTRNRADVIARTEIQRVSNAVSRTAYDANQDVIKGIQRIETLDRRTCIACGVGDGKIYYYTSNIANAPALPAHPRCRGAYSPITKSWRELGINKDEIPLGDRPYVFDKEKGLTGRVPDSTTYQQWLRSMETKSPGFAADVLGPTRYKLWKSGKLRLTEMAKGNRILKIEGPGGLKEKLRRKFGKR